MIPDDMRPIKPGVYMFGRDDGSVKETMIIWTPIGWIPDPRGNRYLSENLAFAVHEPGWWWRRMIVPPSSVDFSKIPSFRP